MTDTTSSIHDLDLQLLCEYYAGLERQGPGSPEATLRALDFVPDLDREAKIADIGCGTGGQTMVLASRVPGRVTGIDLFPAFIEIFNAASRRLNLQNRVRGIVGSMDDLPFAEAEFDLLWSEGAIYNIGFERGLEAWRRYLKPGGYLAVSEISWLTRERPAEIEDFWNNAYPEIDLVSTKLGQLEAAGYAPVATFVLPEACWTDNFYAPQVARQEAFLEQHPDNRAARDLVAEQRREAELYARFKDYFGYAFYIGQKI